MNNPLFRFNGATIARGPAEVIRGLSWEFRRGQTWAVVGPNGSGKTTLAEAVAGRHRVAAGSLERPGLPCEAVKFVSFREQSHRFSYSRHYYQQRFNFIEPGDDLTLGEYLDGKVEATVRMGVSELLNLSLIKLSNGQMRRARLAKALASRPGLLALDDPFMGLDAAGRDDLSAVLGGLAGDVPLLLLSPTSRVPDWVTDVLELPVREPVVELNNVSVQHGDARILDRLSWTMRAGERWALLGPNGSGKSTLLSLIAADHPQAYSNDVRLFGRRRGTGETVWEVKSRIGLLSPELHLYFNAPMPARRAAGTGFFDVVTPRRLSESQAAAVDAMFKEFGLGDLADRPFGQLSTGQQRLVLFVRALVKRPPLVILDEPFQGLDESAAAAARSWLDRHLNPEQSLIFVTHFEHEIPDSVRHTLTMPAGTVTARGSAAGLRPSPRSTS